MKVRVYAMGNGMYEMRVAAVIGRGLVAAGAVAKASRSSFLA
jgi:hypothetical protein